MTVAIILAITILAAGFYIATRSVPVAVVTNPVGYEVTDNDPLEGISAVGTPIDAPVIAARFQSLVTRGAPYLYVERGSLS